jgi:anti-repressor protein
MFQKDEALGRAVEARTEGRMQSSAEHGDHTAGAVALATTPSIIKGTSSVVDQAPNQAETSPAPATTRIPVCTQAFNGDRVQAVDGRDLHAALELRDTFSTWMKCQIDRVRLVENRDYVICCPEPEKSRKGRPRTDYFLTVESAKHIAMMSGTDSGFEVREYFIECERRTRSPGAVLTRLELLNMALESERRALALETQATQDAPKLAALDRIASSDGGVCITNAAKDLRLRPMELFRWMQANSWIYRRPHGFGWLAYQQRLQHGVLEHKITTIDRPDGSQRIVENVLVTPKGLVRLAQIFAQPAETAEARV